MSATFGAETDKSALYAVVSQTEIDPKILRLLIYKST